MSAAHIAGEAGRAGGVSPPSQRSAGPGGSGGSSPRVAAASRSRRRRRSGRAALVGYLPAGFPSVAGAAEAAVAIAQAGADVIEIGLPYSDPLMDGPVIQEATQRALAGGTHVTDVLRTVETVAAAGVPTLVMTYWNPVDHYGVAAFARDLAAAGGAGLITPDLPPEEAGDWLEASDACGLDRVFLVAPSSPDARIARITADCRGFVYAASLMGTTGARDSVGHGRRGAGQPGPRGHQPAGRRRPRRARRSAGRGGGRLRGRGDRRVGVRAAAAGRPGRPGRAGLRP